jgi:enoyl-CoA hydratase/carnithine racemase
MDDDEDPLSTLDKRALARQLSDLLEALTATAALTVAAVEGYCLAGGCGLAAGCDFVVAADDATFGTPEVNVGLFPMQASAPIMRAVREKKGLEMLFTGEFLDAETAEEIGLVTRVLDADTFDADLDEYVATLAGNSPVMIELGKEAYYRQRDMHFDQAHRYLKEMLALLMTSEDHAEGVAAFEEDREPEWVGR